VSDHNENTNPIDPATAVCIRRKVRQIVRRTALNPSDREDLEQDIVLEILRRLPAFDETRGKREAFIRVLLNHAVADLIRKLLSRKVPVPLTLDELAVDDPGERLVSLAQDVETVLTGLPLHLREIAELLKTLSITKAARELGMPRATLQDRVRVLRQRFEQAGLRDNFANSSVS
jgi:RNA polymerase sigma-70 factor (ECF subfamily)